MFSHKSYSFEIDVWSVGVMTYELLTGLSPFAGNSTKETYQNIRIIKTELKNNKKLGVSEEALAFVRRIFVKDAKSRPKPEELLEDKWMMDEKQ